MLANRNENCQIETSKILSRSKEGYCHLSPFFICDIFIPFGVILPLKIYILHIVKRQMTEDTYKEPVASKSKNSHPFVRYLNMCIFPCMCLQSAWCSARECKNKIFMLNLLLYYSLIALSICALLQPNVKTCFNVGRLFQSYIGQCLKELYKHKLFFLQLSKK